MMPPIKDGSKIIVAESIEELMQCLEVLINLPLRLWRRFNITRAALTPGIESLEARVCLSGRLFHRASVRAANNP